jgi:uncharacterized protein YbjQ (UPF0145 family)
MCLRLIVFVAMVISFGCYAESFRLTRPYINSIAVLDLPPRSDTALVEVFLRDTPPDRAHEIVGEIEVSTMRALRSADDMLLHAKARARTMGADALIGVQFGSVTGSEDPYTTYDGNTKKPSGTSTHVSVLRTLKATAVRWRE